MREDVCIVLNERESLKNRAAEELAARLKQREITVSRVPVTPQLSKTLFERNPRIVVADYLLGDYTTGVDLLAESLTLAREVQPVFIFLTDEPSVAVAVEAMRLGAKHYLPIDGAHSIQEIVSLVEKILADVPVETKSLERQVLHLADLTSQDATSNALLNSARAAVSIGYPIRIILGGSGSGRSTLAYAMHLASDPDGAYREIVCDLLDQPLQTILSSRGGSLLKLGQNLSLTLEHAEHDDGEILKLIKDASNTIWPGLASGGKVTTQTSFLTIATASPETATSWQRFFPEAPLLKIPALEERRRDLPMLVQSFQREWTAHTNARLKPLSADIINWLSTLPWPANIRQLRATLFEGFAIGSHDDQLLRNTIEAARSESPASLHDAASQVSALTAAYTLDQCNHSYRAAAARLGVSIQALRALVSTSASSTPRGGA